MRTLTYIFALGIFLLLSACEQRQEQAQAPQQQPAVATQPSATPGTQPGAPAATPEAQRPAGEQTTAAQPPAGQQQPGQETAMARQPGQETPAATPPAEQQQGSQAQKSSEFYGQAPKVEDAPETVVLEAKNGNVTLPHRAHAGMMECKTCHGEGKPGKMADFNKDKAHPLCQGCHKEKSAGPTKCPDCHKK